MRALVQRVSRASVRFSELERAIGPGLLIFLGVGGEDLEEDAGPLAAKCARLRIFSNEQGKFDRSLLDVQGECLVVSQFTLYGDCGQGRRPDFTKAMTPERARPVYERFVSEMRKHVASVRTGEFGARMEVELVNDGPVTLWIDTKEP